MRIIQRNNRYFLQLVNGELELDKAQVKKRLQRGDTLEQFPAKPKATGLQPAAGHSKNKDTERFVDTEKYFERILKKFKEIYRLSGNREQTAEKLLLYCKTAIHKLETDRKNPRTDHTLIDFYILSWSRIISFLQTISKAQKEKSTSTLQDEKDSENPGKRLRKQTLIIRLLQTDGRFPVNNALEGISQEDIFHLVSGILNQSKKDVEEAAREADNILLQKETTTGNLPERVQILELLDDFFGKLPYPNIISRLRVLLKIYREKTPGNIIR